MGSNERTFAILTLSGIIGIILAIIVQILYGQGILVDKFINSTFTLREIQLGLIVFCEIFGLVMVALD